ncbi:hypothetical protein [Streptomyces cyaneofuscatus]|uniref:hypothetical protein n=1 Tax=Streptomyces cyaneofuscatus TaxID=66883 RepID=UPI0037B5FEA0
MANLQLPFGQQGTENQLTPLHVCGIPEAKVVMKGFDAAFRVAQSVTNLRRGVSQRSRAETAKSSELTLCLIYGAFCLPQKIQCIGLFTGQRV